jgi:formyl-CoA transferase
MLLAALGAEVIKVEGHRRSDLTRRSVIWPLQDPEPTSVPPNQGMSFNSVNLGKRSLTLDLAHPRGAELAKQLVSVSDIVVDNLRPGAMRRLGLGYEDLRTRPSIRPSAAVPTSPATPTTLPRRALATSI